MTYANKWVMVGSVWIEGGVVSVGEFFIDDTQSPSWLSLLPDIKRTSVEVDAGIGDGSYPVYIKRDAENGWTTALLIDFTSDVTATERETVMQDNEIAAILKDALPLNERFNYHNQDCLSGKEFSDAVHKVTV